MGNDRVQNDLSRDEKGEIRVSNYLTQEELKNLDDTEFTRDVLKRAFLF